MPIRGMLQYAALRERGSETEPERKVILERHRDGVRARIEELQACLLVLDMKIAGYTGSKKRTKNHDAHRNRPK